MKYRIFVYGTLMRGFGNYRRLLEKQATFVREAETPPAYSLLHLGGFPGLIPDGTTSVRGEVFEFDSDGVLEGLDWLEGHPSFYTRTPIQLADGTDVQTYLLNLKGSNPYKIVESGNWRMETGVQAPKEELV